MLASLLAVVWWQAAIEEGDEDSVSRVQSAIHRDGPEGADDNLDDLPWHHAQLAMMYGRQVADDIVHPQMEPKKVEINPNLMRPEGEMDCSYWFGVSKNLCVLFVRTTKLSVYAKTSKIFSRRSVPVWSLEAWSEAHFSYGSNYCVLLGTNSAMAVNW